MKKSSDNMRRAGVNVARLKSTIRRVEQQPYDATAGRRAPLGPGPLQFAKTTTAITARSGTVAGSGTVALQMEDSAGNLLAVPAATTLLVQNFGGAIVTGKYCVIAWFSGNWFIISVEC